MADAEHLIVVPENIHPWNLVFEVADATSSTSWVLVGGLMVHAHAIRAGVNGPRPTGDIDLLMNIGAHQISAVAAPLQQLGFRPLEPVGAGPFHRFTREHDIVDVMVGTQVRARWAQRAVLQAPGARQALQRVDWYTLQGQTRRVRIGVPDELAAIIAKAAAFQIDQREPGRHLEDLAVLLASAGGRRVLSLDRLTPGDRRHLRGAVTVLSDRGHEAWAILDSPDRAVGQRALGAVADAVGDITAVGVPAPRRVGRSRLSSTGPNSAEDVTAGATDGRDAVVDEVDAVERKAGEAAEQATAEGAAATVVPTEAEAVAEAEAEADNVD